MATSLTACLQQANSSNLISKERTIVCEVGVFCNRQTVRIRSYGGRELVNFDRVSSWPSSLVCSTSSSRSRDSSMRRNSRSPNPKQQGRTNVKVVGVQPGDMRLLRDLQEFISSNGLPPNQVPSIRELAKRGRQDLANAVRRRGDKAVSQLLANPNFLNSSGVPSKTAKPPLPGVRASGTLTSSTSNGVLNPEIVPSPRIQPQGLEKSSNATDLIPHFGAAPLVPYYRSVLESGSTGFFQQRDLKTGDNHRDASRFRSSRPGDDIGRRNQGVPRTLDVTNVSKVAAEIEEGDSDDEDHNELYTYEDSSDDEEDDNWTGPKPTGGFPESRESEAWQQAAKLKTKIQSLYDNPISKVISRSQQDSGAVFDILAKQREAEKSLELEQNSNSQESFRAEPVKELDRLTTLLHTRDMEHLNLSRELEETKALLALVRARHAAEAAQLKQVALESSLRLQAAEQALHSLKLVQVDWWGEGNRVELAGSFNGWEHHVYLLPELSSEIPHADGSRGPMLWKVDLWLYPGVFEIKFIVDGKWQLDHRRETVHRHMGHNNLLRVEL